MKNVPTRAVAVAAPTGVRKRLLVWPSTGGKIATARRFCCGSVGTDRPGNERCEEAVQGADADRDHHGAGDARGANARLKNPEQTVCPVEAVRRKQEEHSDDGRRGRSTAIRTPAVKIDRGTSFFGSCISSLAELISSKPRKL